MKRTQVIGIGIGAVVALFVAGQFSVWWFSSSHLDSEVAEALEEDRASWPEPSTDDAKEALAFLESQGEDVLKLVEISRELPRRLDAAMAVRCAALSDELDSEFEFTPLLAAASSIPESVLHDVATSQVMALSDGLESCRAEDEQQCRKLFHVAAGLSDSFDARVSQLRALR